VRWYEYLFVLVLFVFSMVFNYYLNERNRLKVKAVDVVSIMDMKMRELMEREDLSHEERLKEMQKFIERIESELGSEEGIVLIKQVIVGGRYEDITRRYITEKP